MFAILAGVAIKSIGVLANAWIITSAMRNRSAAARHLVWIAAAAALLALPLLSIALPQFEMPGTAALSAVANFSTTATASPSINAAPALPDTVKTTANSPRNYRAITVQLPRWIVAIWIIGAIFGLARMIAGTFAVWRVRRNAQPFSDQALAAELARSLGITREIGVLESRPGSMPMTFGLLKPAIFMPADAIGWTDDRRRVVLLHELAHIRRNDIAAHLFVRVAFTFYWWNPLVWTAWREFLKERERATDDLVLNAGTRASEYAGHLLEVARTMQSAPALGWAAIAMARRSQLEGRLVAILDTDVNRNTTGRAGAWVAAAIAIAMVAPLAALRAQDPQAATIPPDVDAYIRAANAQKNHEMLDKAAKAALELRKYDTAQVLLKTSADIQGDVAGRQSTDYALALMKVGDVEERLHRDASAAEFYTKAANILGNKPEAVPALMFLGTRAIKNPAVAFHYFEQAETADPQHAGNAVMWMAIVRRSEGRFDESASLFRRALDLQDPRSTNTVATMQMYAGVLRNQGNTAEALELETRAEVLRKVRALSRPASVLSAGTYKIGGDVSQPRLLQKMEPEYTQEARAAKWQGTVQLEIIVGEDGTPRNIRVVRPLGLGLDEKAVEAVSQWRFDPGTKDGAPVPVIAVIDVNFRLL